MFSGNVEIELYPMSDLPQGTEPGAAVLSAGELDLCRKLKTAKRRRDWLSGRIAVKRLVRRKLAAAGVRLELNAIEVYNHESGEPYVKLPALSGLGLNIRVSISHSRQYALAAMAEQGARLGADVETIEPREKGWLDLMAHESERIQAVVTNPAAQTVLWTLKESVLKVLGVGLTVDLHDVRFVQDEDGTPVVNIGPVRLELHGKARRVWEELRSPSIAFENSPMGDNSMISVAYTSNFSRNQGSRA
jgi:4'-phosphopantetheinyl transferase